MKKLKNNILALIRFILINLQAKILTLYRAHTVARWSDLRKGDFDLSKSDFSLLSEPKAVVDNKHLLQFYLSGVTHSVGHAMSFKGSVIAYKTAISDIENSTASALWGSLIFEPLTWLTLSKEASINYNPHHRNLVNILKKKFWRFSFWTFFMTGDVRHGILAGKAAFSLVMSWKTKSRFWFGMYKWYAYKTRMWQKLYTDKGKTQCATIGRCEDLITVEKGLSALALFEKELLDKEDFLVPWQHLPRYYTMSAVSEEKAKKLDVPYWLLGAMCSINNFIGAAHVIKTLSGNSDTLFDYFSSIFGPLQAIPRVVKLYPSPGSGTFHVYPKANKVIYKWVNDKGTLGGVLTVWGNSRWGLDTLKKDLVPHHLKLWVWEGSPEKGRWFIKDNLSNASKNPLAPPPYNGDTSDYKAKDRIGCRVKDNGIQVFYGSNHYLTLIDEVLTFKTNSPNPFWITHEKGHSCFTHFKNYSLCQTKKK